MKKAYFIVIALVIVMMAAVSCTGAPKSKGDSPALEAPPPPEPVEKIADIADIEDIEDIADTDEIAGIDTEDVEQEEPGFEEPVLAEADDEEEPSAENEPAPPVVAAVPEPPPPPPPPATPPPSVTARPTPPPAAPRPAAPTPPPATPRPPATPPPAVTPPQAPAPPPRPAETPPAVAPEPELSNPTPAFRGRPDDEEISFSRVVRATAGQLVVVPFRGTGWVYLGEAGAQRGISYDSRRLDPEGQSFFFRTETPGEYALKFYRQDFIRDFILNDYVKVIVGDPPETAGTAWFTPPVDRGRVIAEPRWPTSLEEAQALRSDTQSSRRAPTVSDTPSAPAPTAQVRQPPVQPPAQTLPASPPVPPPAQPPRAQTPPAAPLAQTPPAPPPMEPVPAEPPPESPAPILELEPDEYLKKAKEEFDAGRVASAIAYLDRFCQYYPVESDEVLWLYGQLYEANSPSRNILSALDCYRRLTREYPQSSRFDDARRRIAYLQRYYINIQ